MKLQIFIFFSIFLGFLDQLQIAVVLDVPKAFGRVWHAGFLHKPKSYGISDRVFDLSLCFLSNGRLWFVLDGKSSQEYLVNAGAPQRLILDSAFFWYTLMTFLIGNVHQPSNVSPLKHDWSPQFLKSKNYSVTFLYRKITNGRSGSSSYITQTKLI